MEKREKTPRQNKKWKGVKPKRHSHLVTSSLDRFDSPRSRSIILNISKKFKEKVKKLLKEMWDAYLKYYPKYDEHYFMGHPYQGNYYLKYFSDRDFDEENER